jgi:hypothetical protein
MQGVVFGVAIADWVTDLTTVAANVALVMASIAVPGLFLWGLCRGAVRLGIEINTTTITVINQFESSIRKQQATGVPAFATLVGTIGGAMSNLVVSPGMGAVVAIVGGLVTFAFATLAQDSDKGAVLRWLFVIGAMVPFVGLTAALFASGNFESFSLTTQLILGAGLAVGVVGLTGVLVSAVKRVPPAELATA